MPFVSGCQFEPYAYFRSYSVVLLNQGCSATEPGVVTGGDCDSHSETQTSPAAPSAVIAMVWDRHCCGQACRQCWLCWAAHRPPGWGSSPALGSGPRYQILSHVFACCASQKTHAFRVQFSHIRVFSDLRNVRDTNHIPRATAYWPQPLCERRKLAWTFNTRLKWASYMFFWSWRDVIMAVSTFKAVWIISTIFCSLDSSRLKRHFLRLGFFLVSSCRFIKIACELQLATSIEKRQILETKQNFKLFGRLHCQAFQPKIFVVHFEPPHKILSPSMVSSVAWQTLGVEQSLLCLHWFLGISE